MPLAPQRPHRRHKPRPTIVRTGARSIASGYEDDASVWQAGAVMHDPLGPPIASVRAAVARALDEDLTPLGDITSALLPRDLTTAAAFAARSPGVLAGIACAAEAFRQIDESVEVNWLAADGDDVDAKQVLGRVEGPLRSILTAERTALN